MEVLSRRSGRFSLAPKLGERADVEVLRLSSSDSLRMTVLCVTGRGKNEAWRNSGLAGTALVCRYDFGARR